MIPIMDFFIYPSPFSIFVKPLTRVNSIMKSG